MKLTAHKLSEDQAKEISNWKYIEEYSIYNLPSWDNIDIRKLALENYKNRIPYREVIESHQWL